MDKCRAIVIGCSAGGLSALEHILCGLPDTFNIPIIIVQHRQPSSDMLITDILREKCGVELKEAEDKEPIKAGMIYMGPANYHLLVEPDGLLTLSVDEKEHFARPSIDVLFESAADVYRDSLIGIILTGASSDGALGLKRIKALNGLTIVQDPSTAESQIMPQAAIDASLVDFILPLKGITDFLQNMSQRQRKTS